MRDLPSSLSDSSAEADDLEISVSAAGTNPRPIVDDNVTGERFGRYILIGELATGGMAEVFLGVKKGLEGFVKVVVIKRVLPHYCSNAHFIRMFIDEARLAARLEHPNIVRTYEFGEVDGQYFTVMEYLPGEDLLNILRRLAVSRQKMPLHLAAGMVSQICAGLQFAHDLTDTAGRPLNLVHRDINPSNILITYGGEVKIIDFGVAKTNTNAETVTGTIKGKISYMAPEQILSRGVDQRTDIFSAGVVLWELLTGVQLFRRDTEAATLYAIMNDPIPLPSRLRPDVPRELDAIVARALSRTPADRYDSAEDMAAALEAFLAKQPKYDARVLAAKVEELFGSTRAEAKRSIAQTRSLGSNISLVMKLRTSVRAELAAKLDSLGSADEEEDRDDNAVAQPPQRSVLVALALVIVTCLAIALVYLQASSSSDDRPAPTHVVQGTVQLTSTPSGAAVFIAGEPTGLKTPATLSSITAKQVSIRLELPDYGPVTETLDVPAGGTVAKHFAFKRAR